MKYSLESCRHDPEWQCLLEININGSAEIDGYTVMIFFNYKKVCCRWRDRQTVNISLVNVYVNLLVFTRIAGTS